MKSNTKKIRILTVLPGLAFDGGMQNYVMNYYNLIHNDISMDFIVHKPSDDFFKNKIQSNGDNVYKLLKFNLRNYFRNKRAINIFFKSHHDYDIIHCHMANAASLYFKAAKKYGINVRIMHSHQYKYADILSHSIRNWLLVKLGLRYATHYFACSKRAGDFLFKGKKYYIINNAIDVSRFRYDEKVRATLRRKLGINSSFAIGTVGRLCPAKNQKFLIDVFRYINQKTDSKLLIVGNGALRTQLASYAKESGLENNVLFIEPSARIEQYYQAMDYFVLPSLFEGLGIVNIEAQCSGLRTLVSTNVPKEARVSELVSYLDLAKGAEYWANNIIEHRGYSRTTHAEDVTKHGYNLSTEKDKLLYIYRKITKESYGETK